MRPRIAVITTVYRPLCHTDVIVSRWIEPRPTDPQFGWPLQPRTQIASLYIAQFPENDIGRETAARHGVPIYDSVRAALTLGGDGLAVDGVLLIGEHGEYPTNEWNQKMYPRRELFDAIVEVFCESGRSVPIFNDKHLSFDAGCAFHMVKVAREMGFGLMAGSSVPLAGTLEAWTMPDGTPLQAGFGVSFRNTDINGYHLIEWLQSLVARRYGGEAGIESVTAYRGESFRQALSDGIWSSELMNAAFEQTRKSSALTYRESVHAAEPSDLPTAFSFQHRDGLQTTYLIGDTKPAEFLAAVAQADGTIHSACSHLNSGSSELFCPHFAMLCAKIEEFLLSGRSPYPLQHSLFCTLATAAACHAISALGQQIETPQLDFSYRLDAAQQ